MAEVKVSISTNYVGENEKAKIRRALEAGRLVRVSSPCIGHTRAEVEMVRCQGEAYMRSLGAVPVEPEDGSVFGDWFKLN